MRIVKWLTNIIILGSATILLLLVFYEIAGYKDVLSEVPLSPFYYAILIAILIALLLSLRLHTPYKINLALSLGSIMFVLYILEAVLLSRSSAPARIADDINVPFDRRNKLEVIDQFERDGVEAFPDVVLFDLIKRGSLDIDGKTVVPLSGVSDKLIVACNETGEWLIYQSDEHGFHNPKGLYSPKDISIVALGDSFTRGSCVKSEQNAVAVIRNTYPKTLNLGRGGNGPLIELATLKEYAEPLKPKIVLWIYFDGNDLDDLTREKKVDTLLRYLDKDYSQNLLAKQPEIDAALIKFINSERVKAEAYENTHPLLKFLMFDNLRNQVDKYLNALKRDPADYDLFRQVLASAKDSTSSWGGELYFVFLPSRSHFNEPDSEDPSYARVLNIVNDLDIPIIDLASTFAAHPDPKSLLPFRGYGHFNAEGYKVFGETILQFIEKRNELTPLEQESNKKVGSEANGGG